jgi:hypothetical protein
MHLGRKLPFIFSDSPPGFVAPETEREDTAQPGFRADRIGDASPRQSKKNTISHSEDMGTTPHR